MKLLRITQVNPVDITRTYTHLRVATPPVYNAIVAPADSPHCITAEDYMKRFGEYTVDTIDNDPKFYRIVGLCMRSGGGRAWKVIDDVRRLYDLREEELLDIMDRSTIDHGKILCPLVWIKNRSQMRLTRVGSPNFLDRADAEDLGRFYASQS